MNKIEFILKFGRFSKDPLGTIGCSDENIWGHYNKEITVGKSKEEAAKEMVNLYDKMYKGDNSAIKRQLCLIGWADGDALEISNEKLKNIYLSIIADSDWLLSQNDLAPIGREYLFKEFMPSSFWASFYKKFFNKIPSDYQELFSDIREIKDENSFEFQNYRKEDCIREGFFQVFSQKPLDELKSLLQQIKQS
jgi:hypothetical protein